MNKPQLIMTVTLILCIRFDSNVLKMTVTPPELKIVLRLLMKNSTAAFFGTLWVNALHLLHSIPLWFYPACDV